MSNKIEHDTEVKREQKDRDVLILEKLAHPRKLWSKGKRMSYVLIYRWLRDENNQTSILGTDKTFWTAKEGREMIKNGLFKNVNLF